MIANLMRRAILALAVLAILVVAVEAHSACCGGGTTAYYGGHYNTNYAGSHAAYYPSTYQTYYGGTGWYPGYYWDRARTRLWGSPTTYVAAYPTTAYYGSYAPSYSASYAPSYSASYAPAYASYAAPAGCSSCSTCQGCTAGYSPCSSCGVQAVTLRPVCATACASPCGAGCSTCGSHVVTQTSHEAPACSCGNGSAHVRVQQTAPPPNTPDPASIPTFGDSTSGSAAESKPTVSPDAAETERREGQKPADGTEAQPGPGGDTNGTPAEDPYDVKNSTDAATMFEAPRLHDPNDRTASRSIAPVKNALYKQPVGYRNVSTKRITAEQARQDAIGWTSASK